MTTRALQPSEAAPLDPIELTRSLAPFGESVMLPRAAYIDPAVAAWERRHLFEGSWVCLGRSASVARPGDQRAEQVGDTGVLLVRRTDRTLAAFANTCRHRGHELLACGASTHRATVVCPYHAWSYELDGSLHSAPRFPEARALGADVTSLVELRTAEWGGWAFVNVDGEAPAFVDHAGGIVDLLANHVAGDLVVGATHRYDLAANWKLVHENYHECYHCPSIHPELSRVSPPSSGCNVHGHAGAWVAGAMELATHAVTMSLDGHSGGAVIESLEGAQRRTVTYVGVVPDLLISAHPDYVLTHRLVPHGPTRTSIECQWLFPREVAERAGFDPGYAVEFWDLTNRQDWAAVESIQRAMASTRYRPGVLAPNEDAVYEFVTMIARAYLGPGEEGIAR